MKVTHVTMIVPSFWKGKATGSNDKKNARSTPTLVQQKNKTSDLDQTEALKSQCISFQTSQCTMHNHPEDNGKMH